MSSSTPAKSATTGTHEAGDNQQLQQQDNILSYEQIVIGSNIQVSAWQTGTAFEFWDYTIDIEQPLDRKQVNTYIGQLVAEYQGISTLRSLVRVYQEDFEGWNTIHFRHGTRVFKRALVRRLV
jgi:hypothetical protein